MATKTASGSELETVHWEPVPDTRTPGDEILVAYTRDGVCLRTSLVEPGFAVTYADLWRIAEHTLPAGRE